MMSLERPMTFKSRLLPAMALLASVSAPALAADLGEIIPAPIVEDTYTPVEIGSGWYIRGDISYDLQASMGADYRTYGQVSAGPPATYAYGSDRYDNFDLEATGDFSVGFGYRYNNWLRADATLGYWSRDINGTDTTAGVGPIDCDPNFPGEVSCRSEDTSSVTAWELMANAYADLGTYVGLTPYVGAGAGFTRLDYERLNNTTYCLDAGGVDIAGCGYSESHDGLASWRFTWALSAGVSYDLTKNTKVDLGYRYSHVQGGDMFGWDALSAGIGATGVQGSDDGFSQHSFKAGLRYEIW
jgi:opacity protein-like surface antigen